MYLQSVYVLAISSVLNIATAAYADDVAIKELNHLFDANTQKIQNEVTRADSRLDQIRKRLQSIKPEIEPPHSARLLKTMQLDLARTAPPQQQSVLFEPLNQYYLDQYASIEASREMLMSKLNSLKEVFENQKNGSSTNELSNCNVEIEKLSDSEELKEVLLKFEKRKELINATMHLKLQNLESEGKQRVQDLKEIRSTAQLLVKDYTSDLSSEVRQLQSSFEKKLRDLSKNCLDAQAEVRKMQDALKEELREAEISWNGEVKKLREKLEELETISIVEDIRKVTEEGEVSVGPDDLPPLNGNRKFKFVNLTETDVDLDQPITQLYEQQRFSKYSDVATMTSIKNGGIFKVEKWVIMY